MKVAWLVAVAGCGRIAFDPIAPGDGATERCPTGYALISGSAPLGTADFCAMTFEARARSIATDQLELEGCDTDCPPNSFIATHLPASSPEGLPWRAIDAVQARLRCQALGAAFDLMSNREWMTIAREAERTGSNWSSGTPGTGSIVEGNTDNTGFAMSFDLDDPYAGTDNSAADPVGAGWEQRRTLELTDGTTLWDLPGNLQEWVDWTTGGALDGPPTPCTGAELPAFACAGITDDDFNSSTGTLDSSFGVGKVLGGSGNTARRGGQTSDRAIMIAGIYALNMNRESTDTFPGTSFRCVMRL